MRRLLVACLFSVLAVGSANADTIFADNFNRGDNNTVGYGWTEIEDENDDVAIMSQYLLLRDNRIGIDAAVIQSIDTIGYEDIWLDFSWAASSNTEGSDELNVSWDNGSGGAVWTNLWNTTLGGSTFASVSLSIPLATNHAGFQFAFWTDVSWYNESASVDYVVMRGALIQESRATIPEPATMLLFGTGLIGLAGVSIRRKKK